MNTQYLSALLLGFILTSCSQSNKHTWTVYSPTNGKEVGFIPNGVGGRFSQDPAASDAATAAIRPAVSQIEEQSDDFLKIAGLPKQEGFNQQRTLDFDMFTEEGEQADYFVAEAGLKFLKEDAVRKDQAVQRLNRFFYDALAKDAQVIELE